MNLRLSIGTIAVLSGLAAFATLRPPQAAATTTQVPRTGRTKVLYVHAAEPLYQSNVLTSDHKGDIKCSQIRHWQVDGVDFAQRLENAIDSLIANGYAIHSVTPLVRGIGRSIERNGQTLANSVNGGTIVSGGYGSGVGMGMTCTQGAVIVGVR